MVPNLLCNPLHSTLPRVVDLLCRVWVNTRRYIPYQAAILERLCIVVHSYATPTHSYVCTHTLMGVHNAQQLRCAGYLEGITPWDGVDLPPIRCIPWAGFDLARHSMPRLLAPRAVSQLGEKVKITVPLLIDIDIPDAQLPALAARQRMTPPERGQDAWYRRLVRSRVLGLVNALPEWADDPGVNARPSINRLPVSRPVPAPQSHGPWALTAHP